MRNKQNKFTISSTFSLTNSDIQNCISGELIKNSSTTKEINDITQNIFNAINSVFEKYSQKQEEKYKEFKNHIDNREYDLAYNILEKNIFFRFDDLFEYLEKFDFEYFSDKNNVATIFLIKCKIKEDECAFDYIAKEIPTFISKYEKQVENKGIINEFKYVNAYANYKLNNKEVSLVLANELIQDANIDKNIKRRLYWLKFKLEQNLRYLEIAGDIALEEGDVRETIALRMNLADEMIKIDINKTISIVESLEELCKTNDINDKQIIAKIQFNKASYLFALKDYNSALVEIEKAIFNIDDIAGDTINNSRHTYCCLALQLAKNLQDNSRIIKYQKEIEELRPKLIDKEYVNQLDISKLLEEKKYKEIEKLKEKYLKEQNYYFVYLANSTLAVFSDYTFAKKITYLDEIDNLKDKIPLRESDKAMLYNLYSHLFLENKIYDKFLQYAQLSLNLNIYNQELRQNYIAILVKQNKWNEVEDFSSKCINRFGEFPNLMFLYAKSVLMQNKEPEETGRAMGILGKVIPKLCDELQKEANNLILEQAKKGISANRKYFEEKSSTLKEITLSDFETAVEDFKKNIEQKIRMTFWKYNKKEEDKHEYINSPELMAKTNFISFMNSRFKDNVTIIDECPAGAGYIDVYLIFSTFTIVVELKMCGHGYSSTYAISGKDQLKHYLDNSNSKLGYLLVFDSRIRDFNRFTKETIDDKTYNIITNVIDIKPVVK